MRIHAIAYAAISVVAGCSSELAQRPAANDPTNVAAVEAPFIRPPAYETDPLLSPTPPKSAAAPPTGMQHDAPAKSPTTIYTCPMHPEVRVSKPGQCPKCGMTLVPVTPKAGDQ